MHDLTRFVGIVSAGVFVAIAGCSSDNDGGSAGPLDALVAQVKAARCADAVDCHEAETQAECEASIVVNFVTATTYVENGTTKYHPEKVEACLEALRINASCKLSDFDIFGSDAALVAACDDIFEGTFADGEACSNKVQCASGQCELDATCMAQCCTGICVAKPPQPPVAKIGEACVDMSCEWGAYCQKDAMGNPTTCAAQLAAGQPCSSPRECKGFFADCVFNAAVGMDMCVQPAATGQACDPNLFNFACNRTDEICDETTKVCKLKGLVGAPCTVSKECVKYAHCDAGTCVKDFLAGAACDYGTNTCLGGLICSGDGVCEFPPAPAACP